ncbi:hypothetical protein H1C71_036166, partial [Ictidomys tridecemlineatus]
HFLQTCSSERQGQGPATAASVEYLQEVARTRLCLDRASDLLLEFQEGSELAEEQQGYLQHVQQFCTQAGNDWHRVYLVRRLASLRGMEFVQSLSRQGHRYQWVFPKGVIAQQVRRRFLAEREAMGTTPHPPSPHDRQDAGRHLVLGLCFRVGLGHLL